MDDKSTLDVTEAYTFDFLYSGGRFRMPLIDSLRDKGF